MSEKLNETQGVYPGIELRKLLEALNIWGGEEGMQAWDNRYPPMMLYSAAAEKWWNECPNQDWLLLVIEAVWDCVSAEQQTEVRHALVQALITGECGDRDDPIYLWIRGLPRALEKGYDTASGLVESPTWTERLRKFFPWPLVRDALMRKHLILESVMSTDFAEIVRYLVDAPANMQEYFDALAMELGSPNLAKWWERATRGDWMAKILVSAEAGCFTLKQKADLEATAKIAERVRFCSCECCPARIRGEKRLLQEWKEKADDIRAAVKWVDVRRDIALFYEWKLRENRSPE